MLAKIGVKCLTHTYTHVKSCLEIFLLALMFSTETLALGGIGGGRSAKARNNNGVQAINAYICANLDCSSSNIKIVEKCANKAHMEHGICMCDDGCIGDGITCRNQNCPAGQIPNADNSACVNCEANQSCVTCTNTTLPNGDGNGHCVCSSTSCGDSYCNASGMCQCSDNATCSGGTFTCKEGYKKNEAEDGCIINICSAYPGADIDNDPYNRGDYCGVATDGITLCFCSMGKKWNETSCVDCNIGEVCGCPVSTAWTGNQCCPVGYRCDCPKGQIFTFEGCKECIDGDQCDCDNGYGWDIDAQECRECRDGDRCGCASGDKWNSDVKMCIPCQVKDRCGCDDGAIWDGESCCTVGTRCNCDEGAVWQMYEGCVACAVGDSCDCGGEPSFWNGQSCSDRCPMGQKLDGSTCVDCNIGDWCECGSYGSWDGTECCGYGSECNCTDGKIWNGTECINCNIGDQCWCDYGSKWDGTSCVSCKNGDKCGCGEGKWWLV